MGSCCSLQHLYGACADVYSPSLTLGRQSEALLEGTGNPSYRLLCSSLTGLPRSENSRGRVTVGQNPVLKLEILTQVFRMVTVVVLQTK